MGKNITIIILSLLCGFLIISTMGMSETINQYEANRVIALDAITRYDNCISTAHATYSRNWDSRCSTLSMYNNCELSLYDRYDLNEKYLDDMIACGQ